MPKYLKPEEVERVVHACQRDTAVARRDHAIVLLLARLGLRASEVIALELDDIDWRAGVLKVRGKGRSHDCLPLPADVGEAMANYLRHHRPPCTTRRLFIRTRAPHRGFAHPSSISTIVCRALKRAGLQPCLHGGARPAALPGDRDAPFGGVPGRDRRGPSPPRAEHHGDLREGRCPEPPFARTALAHERG